MAAQGEDERVKPCPACDRWIPYHARSCPHCGKVQPLEGWKDCPVCSASIPAAVLFCPECGRPAVPCAFMPGWRAVPPGGKVEDRGDRAERGGHRAIVAAGLLLEVWVILESAVHF